jgi:5-methylcytosine-specific restriction endonuclease McrA
MTKQQRLEKEIFDACMVAEPISQCVLRLATLEGRQRNGAWLTSEELAEITELREQLPEDVQWLGKVARRLKYVVESMEFFGSRKWADLRYEVLRERGARCECCGASKDDDGVVIQVDHIRPRSKYPELAWDKTNLQVLCKECNTGKSNRYFDDWRKCKST